MRKKLLKQSLSAVLTAGMIIYGTASAGIRIDTYAATVENAEYTEENAAFFKFSDTAVEKQKGVETGESCEVEGTDVTIKAAGTYVFAGECANGSIKVKKNVTGVTIVLDGLSLTSTDTAPLVVKSGAEVLVCANAGSVNSLADEETDDSSDDYEGAAIKVKNSGSLTLSGEGKLKIFGTADNGIKGAEYSQINIEDIELSVVSSKNGIASDNSVNIQSGTINIKAAKNGIKAADIVLNAESLKVTAAYDGIQADNTITADGGIYNITTNGGADANESTSVSNNGNYTDTSDDESRKGLKAGTSIIISGGKFSMDTYDDAVHCDGDITVTNGIFAIKTGDDGMHADDKLIIGSEGETSGPTIEISKSYEGLEAANVYYYSGSSSVTASDDGVNAAGGSSNGTDPGMGRGDNFGPGGNNRPSAPGENSSDTSAYAITIKGGYLYVNAGGDGLDSNGDIYIDGGDVIVFGMAAGGDNEPLDVDGSKEINGGRVFAAGGRGMDSSAPGGTQGGTVTTASYSSGTVLKVMSGSTIICAIKLLRNVDYVMYSGSEGDYTFTVGNESDVQNYALERKIETDIENIDDETDDASNISDSKKFSYGIYKYKITSVKNNTVSCIGMKKSVKKIVIPSVVKYKGITYRVTKIASGAFKNREKVTAAVIGKNVKSIGSKAFYNCKELKSIVIKSNRISSINSSAIKGIKSDAVIKVPSGKLKKYKLLLTNKTGFKKTMKICEN